MVDSYDPDSAGWTFSTRLDYALAVHQLSNREFAKLVNSDSGQQMVTNWRKRGRIGGASMDRVQEILPWVSVMWINTGEGHRGQIDAKPETEHPEDPSIAQIPIWDARAAAGVSAVNDCELQTGSILFRPRSLMKQGIHQDSAHVFFVIGDSMAPRLREGDVVMFDTSNTRVLDGKVYVIQWGEDTLVKRLYKELDGSIRVTSDNKANPEYRDRIVEADAYGFQVLGRVRWVGSWED